VRVEDDVEAQRVVQNVDPYTRNQKLMAVTTTPAAK
jgi:hypothetical protein